MKPIYIYGAGGLGREIQSLLRFLPEWKLEGYYDDGKRKGESVGVSKILGGEKDLGVAENSGSIFLIIGIGSPDVKARIVSTITSNRISFPQLIHPNAVIQDPGSVKLGDGVVITAGVILTTGISTGRHVLLNLNCTVGHDVTIGDYSSIMPGANISGNVQIGKKVLIGAGSNILNGVSIGDDAIVGAGSVVVNDVKSGETVVGVPAKPIKRS
ncbi:acetyltransferase [Oscillatoria amoena NRMC-F 0135]|nr:acetyltransferase [Oscillatoria amoena NRMC-F 0135]